MDYVVPVITEDYLKSIRSPELVPSVFDVLSPLDAHYARYIYDMMVKNYVDNSCRNKKFFSIIPKELCVDSNELRKIHEEFMKESVLRIFGYENDLNEFVKRYFS